MMNYSSLCAVICYKRIKRTERSIFPHLYSIFAVWLKSQARQSPLMDWCKYIMLNTSGLYLHILIAGSLDLKNYFCST